jgi:hypothetical protein
MWEQMLNRMGGALERLAEAILSVVPALIVLLVSVSVGVLVGLGLRALLGLVLRVRGRDAAQGRAHGWMRAAGFRAEPARVVGAISFWTAVTVALVVGVNALEPGALKNAMSEVVAFIPRILTSLLVFVAGLAVAAITRHTVLIAAVNGGVPWARGVARIASTIVLAFFFAIALGHFHVGRAILIATYSIVTGSLALALALAFGLGGRDLARRYLERRLRADQEDTGIRHL